MEHAKEIGLLMFPSRDQAAEIVHPGEEPFHLPAPAIPAELPSILGFAPALAIGRDQVDVVLLRKRFVERVGVVGFVADQPCRQFVEEASSKDMFHQLALGR